MIERSAGVLLYRTSQRRPEVLLVHPGGPHWRGRYAGAWQIPKGLIADGETARDAAIREAEEELGIRLSGNPTPLLTIRQAGGKHVDVFALEQDVDAGAIRSNSFQLEWPRGSGVFASYLEIDAAKWFALTEAVAAMLKSQRPAIAALERYLARRPGPQSIIPGER